MHVNFQEQGYPTISANRGDVRNQLEHYLRAEGRRRVSWLRLLSVLPATAGISLIPLWITAVASEGFDVPTAGFGWVLAVGGLISGLLASRKIARAASTRPKGHRFRESTRADFRAAVTSVRAGVLTSAGGTVLGVVLTVIFYKLTGIDPA